MNGTSPACRNAASSASRHLRLALSAIAFAAPIWSLGCSSVTHINDRAALAQSESSPPPVETPMLPWTPNVRSEYRIGPRDVLEVEIYELEAPNESKVLKTRVSQTGEIVLPLIGTMRVTGKTAAELQRDIIARLEADYLIQPTAQVLVAEFESRSVTVLGAVKNPGTIKLQANSTTLIDAIAFAGGVTDDAGSNVFVVRSSMLDLSDAMPPVPTGETLWAAATAGDGSSLPLNASTPFRHVQKIDLEDLVERGNLSINATLDDGDVVHVPAVSHFFVSGLVHHGGSFPLRGEITLLKAIALAGGLKDEASPAATIVIRRTPSGRQTIPVDLNQVEAGTDSDIRLMADDVVLASETGGDRALRNIGSLLRGLFHVSYSLR